MAEKVNLHEIARLTNENIDVFGLGFELQSVRKNSDSEFDKTTAFILAAFLPYFLIYFMMLYEVGDESSISQQSQTELEKIKSSLHKNYVSNQEPKDSEIAYVTQLFDKITPLLTESKKLVLKSDRFINFDSNSEEHNLVLRRDNGNLKEKNMVIKIKSSGEEKVKIRIGLVKSSGTSQKIQWILEDIIKKADSLRS